MAASGQVKALVEKWSLLWDSAERIKVSIQVANPHRIRIVVSSLLSNSIQV